MCREVLLRGVSKVITLLDKDGDTLWSGHIADSMPLYLAPNTHSITADGDELDLLLNCGMPNSGERVQRYSGYIVDTIINNWR